MSSRRLWARASLEIFCEFLISINSEHMMHLYYAVALYVLFQIVFVERIRKKSHRVDEKEADINSW